MQAAERSSAGSSSGLGEAGAIRRVVQGCVDHSRGVRPGRPALATQLRTPTARSRERHTEQVIPNLVWLVVRTHLDVSVAVEEEQGPSCIHPNTVGRDAELIHERLATDPIEGHAIRFLARVPPTSLSASDVYSLWPHSGSPISDLDTRTARGSSNNRWRTLRVDASVRPIPSSSSSTVMGTPLNARAPQRLVDEATPRSRATRRRPCETRRPLPSIRRGYRRAQLAPPSASPTTTSERKPDSFARSRKICCLWDSRARLRPSCSTTRYSTRTALPDHRRKSRLPRACSKTGDVGVSFTIGLRLRPESSRPTRPSRVCVAARRRETEWPGAAPRRGDLEATR